MIRESIRILLSLFVTIVQNTDALNYYHDYLINDSESFKKSELPSKEDLFIDEAIIESLWFQIIIKVCSFLDEYDKFLGVKTEPDYTVEIKAIKKVLAPVRREFNNWKDLKKFRNEFVAHNFRNRDNHITIDNLLNYDCPNSQHELYFIYELLQRMTKIISFNFPGEAEYSFKLSELQIEESKLIKEKDLDEKFYSDKLLEMDKHIRDNVWDIPRSEIVDEMIKSFQNGNSQI